MLVAAWQVAALEAGSRLLPAPMAVLRFIAQEAERGDLAHNIGMTLLRVAISFAVAMVLGVALGVALGRSKAADLPSTRRCLVLLNTPALVITVLAYVWVGLTETAAILAVVLNKLPNVAVIVREGARNLDPAARRDGAGLSARPAHLDPRRPDPAAPALHGHGSPVGPVARLEDRAGGRASRPPRRRRLRDQLLFRQSTDVAAIIGYSLVFMAVMIGIDVLLLQRLEAHVRRWR